MTHQLWGRLTDLYHYEVKGEKALRMVFEGENEEGWHDNVTVFIMAGDQIDTLKQELLAQEGDAIGFRSHNAKLIHCAPYRVGQGQRFVLTFRGSKDCVVDMDATAIAELKEALPEICPCCRQLAPEQTDKASVLLPNGDWDLNDGSPIGPPCGGCRYWNPKYLFGDLICCTEYRRMRPEFSCYRPKGGTE